MMSRVLHETMGTVPNVSSRKMKQRGQSPLFHSNLLIHFSDGSGTLNRPVL